MDAPNGWSKSDDGKALERSFKFKDFSEAFTSLACTKRIVEAEEIHRGFCKLHSIEFEAI